MRIEPSTGLFSRVCKRGSRVTYGRELESAGIYAKHPRLMFDYLRYNRAAERTKRVPKLLAELGVAKAAAMVGCEFCIDISSEYVRRAGSATSSCWRCTKPATRASSTRTSCW